MRKANGRLKPAENKDIANKKEKYFICNNCGAEYTILNIEFGRKYMCEICNSLDELIEKTDG